MESLIRSEEHVNLIICENPFDRRKREVRTAPYRQGQTLFELRQDHFPQDVAVTVSVNGGIISPDRFATFKVMKGDQILFVPNLEGGGGGKNLFKIVAGIVLIVAGFWFPGTWAALGPLLFTGGTAIMLGAGLLLSGVAGLISPLNAAEPQTNNNLSQSYSWTSQNKQAPGGSIPRIYGTFKVYGNITDAFIDLDSTGTVQFLNILDSIGYGPISRVYSPRINDQPVTELVGVQWEARYGRLTQDATRLFNATKSEFPTAVQVKYPTPYTYVTVDSNFDGLEVDVTFPQGLFHADSNGNINPLAFSFRISLRKHGTSDPWVVMNNQVLTVAHTRTGWWSLGYWEEMGGEATYQVWHEGQAGSDVPSDHYEGQMLGGWFWHWLALDHPEDIAASSQDFTTVNRAANSSFVLTYHCSVQAAKGKYDIKIESLTPDSTDLSTANHFYLTAVREVYNQQFTYPREALIAIRAQATSQLSGSLSWSCIVDGLLVAIYDASGNYSIGFSSNPAQVCIDTVTQPVFYDNWMSGMSCGIGQIIRPSVLNGKLYECTVAGASGSSEPTWPTTIDQTVGDGSATWKCIAGAAYDGIARFDGYDPSYIDFPAFKTWADWCDQMEVSGKAAYTVGTVALNNGSPIVTGTGTLFIENARRGQSFKISGDSTLYQIKSVDAESQITLTSNYAGTTGSGKSYEIGVKEARCTFDGVFDTPTNVWDAAWVVANSARGFLCWKGTQISVVVDTKATPSQFFSVGNIIKGSFKETWLPLAERASEININFKNEDNNYGPDTSIIVDSTQSRTNKVSFQMIGITRASQSWRESNHKLLCNKYLLRTIEIGVDIDSIGFELGDPIDIQHDVTAWGEAGGRIVSATNSPPSVVLDKQVTLAQGKTYQILTRTQGTYAAGTVTATLNSAVVTGLNTLFTQNVQIGEQFHVSGDSSTSTYWIGSVDSDTQITLTSTYQGTSGSGKSYTIKGEVVMVRTVTNTNPRPETTNTLTVDSAWGIIPLEFDIYAFGQVNLAVKPFRVNGLKRRGDLTATIQALEYVDGIYDASEGGTPNIQIVKYSQLQTYPVVSNLVLTEDSHVGESDNVVRNINVTWNTDNSSPVDHCEIWYRISGSTSWTLADGMARGNSGVIQNALPSTTYSVTVIGVNNLGAKTPMNKAPTANITTGNVISSRRPGSTFLSLRITGLRIDLGTTDNVLQNAANEGEFTGTNVRFVWNDISSFDIKDAADEELYGAGSDRTNIWFRDYQVDILNTDLSTRRTEYVQLPAYSYSFEKNSQDGNGTPSADFIIQVRARDVANRVSQYPARLEAYNVAPLPVKGLIATATLQGFQFFWNASNELDHMNYQVRTLVAANGGSPSSGWSAWASVETNTYTRNLTPAEVATYGADATIIFQVEDRDVFLQVSTATQDTNQVIPIPIPTFSYQIVANDSDGNSQNILKALFDSITSSGGVVYNV